MKFSCNRVQLSEAVTNVQRAVSSKAAIPALEGIYITAKNDRLTLVGYDLDIAIETAIDAFITEEGRAILNARLLGDILRKAEGEHVNIEVDQKFGAKIYAESSHFEIMGIDPNEFPELPDVSKTQNITIDYKLLQSMVSQTIFAAATTELKPVHTGILFEIDGGVIRLVAVDGYRLAIRTEAIDAPEDMRFIIPAKAMGEILKLAGEDAKEVSFQIGKRHARFNVSGFSLVSRLLYGDFLDYKAAVPKGAATSAVVNTRALIASIDRLSLIITDRIKSPVRMDVRDDGINLKCVTALGRAEDAVACEKSGDDLTIGFNNRYMLDALRATDTDQVRIECNGATAPIKILPMEGDSFLFLVLPVRIANG